MKFIFLSLVILLTLISNSFFASENQSKTIINIHGNILDTDTKSHIAEAEVILKINGVSLYSKKNEKHKPVNSNSTNVEKDAKKILDEFKIITTNNREEFSVSDEKGAFNIKLQTNVIDLSNYSFTLDVKKPSYSSIEKHDIKLMKVGDTSENQNQYSCELSLPMKRIQSYAFWIAALTLFLVYLFIATEKLHRTHAAFLGASILLFITYTIGQFDERFFILSFEKAVFYIDMNVIFLLMAMMIIVGVLKKTGVFQWLSYKSFQISKGNIFILALIIMFVTAVVSAFLDNVTTVLLMIPISIEIAQRLKINPLTILVPIAFASNVGGTLTLIGDPPNILIGSYWGLTFMDFVNNLWGPVTFAFISSSLAFLFFNRAEYKKSNNMNYSEILETLKNECKITDPKLLAYSLIILGITIFMFIIHGMLNMEPSIAALIGASILLMISGHDIVHIVEKEIEWTSLLFFIFLFIVVGANIETGLIQFLADMIKDLSLSTGPEMAIFISMTAIFWISGFASAVIDNIPFTATMLPIVGYLTTTLAGVFPEGTNPNILWWALSLGACLGGNGTVVGASANIVTVGIAEKAGYPISFNRYFKMVIIPTLLTMICSWAWLYLFEM